jgi:hypothetical protein
VSAIRRCARRLGRAAVDLDDLVVTAAAGHEGRVDLQGARESPVARVSHGGGAVSVAVRLSFRFKLED